MSFPPPYPAPTDFTTVAYADATPTQLSQLLLGVQANLQEYFPDLPRVNWWIALARIRPALRVRPEFLTISWEDLTRVTQVLASLPITPASEATGYGPQALYLARCVAKDTALAQAALTELEADPLLYGPHCYELIVQLALNNSVAQEIIGVTEWLTRDSHAPQSDPADYEPVARPKGPSLGERLLAVEQAREQSQQVPSPPAASAPAGSSPSIAGEEVT